MGVRTSLSGPLSYIQKRPLRILAFATVCTASLTVLMLSNSESAAGEDGAPKYETSGTTHCDSADNCTIQYEYLSGEVTDPYLVYGRVPIKSADIKAARRWPDVRSCLMLDERNAERPDVAKINWNRMRRDEDIEVCMFRIFSSLGNSDRIILWFQRQGIRNAKIAPYQFRSQKYNSVTAGNHPSETDISFKNSGYLFNKIMKSIIYSEAFSAI
ncbi:MAG: hypothetical protein HRU33_24345 [Rhodobacteraceae bacterium]|nr:hypothetical protein [Paracoccaceae bacterium]